MTNIVEKWGPSFILFNSLGIVLFALCGALMPTEFWGLLNVDSVHLEFTRIMGWYLFVFGLGGLIVWRNPQRQPAVVMLIGLEKIAPAILFPLLTLEKGAHWLVLAIGIFDGLMAVLCIWYSLWLTRRGTV